MIISLSIIIGWIAGLLTVLGYTLYFISTIRSDTKPNRATWWILLLVGIMLAASYHSLGAKASIWVPLGYVVGPLIGALLSIRMGEGGWTQFDKGCIFGAGIAAIFWWVFQSPFIALIINLSMDWLGLMPTVRKAYYRPHTEDRYAWLCWFVGSFINLFAVEVWTFELSIYPIYMILGNGIIVSLIWWPRKKPN